jgi:sugar-specific transcriptional regulator TrmB
MRNVNDYLKQLGLSDIESKLYLGLLETGSTTVMELANHVGIKRITAHFNVESLISKGLITETRKGARRQIVAEDPEKLRELLDQREGEIQQMKHNLPSIIQSISKTIPKAKTSDDVEIRYYEGKKAVSQVYEETMKATEFYSFAELDNYYAVYPNSIGMWNKVFEDNPNRQVWDLVVDTPMARKIKSETHNRHHMKFLPHGDYFSTFKFSDLKHRFLIARNVN